LASLIEKEQTSCSSSLPNDWPYESMNVETMQNGFLKFHGPSFGQG
jgi:hypothetical protein